MSNNTALNSNTVQECYFLIQNKVDVNLKSVNKQGYLGTKSWAKFAGAISLEPAVCTIELPFSLESAQLEFLYQKLF